MATVSTVSNNLSPHNAVKSSINIIIRQQAVQRQQHMKDAAFSQLEQQKIALKGNSVQPTRIKISSTHRNKQGQFRSPAHAQ